MLKIHLQPASAIIFVAMEAEDDKNIENVHDNIVGIQKTLKKTYNIILYNII